MEKDMKDEILKNFFEQYVQLSEATLQALCDKSIQKAVAKGQILLSEGETCNKILWVAKGCLRLYYISNDVEITVWFSFENDSAIELSSFLSGDPTVYYMEAIQDSEVIVLHQRNLTQLYHAHPSLNKAFRIFWENAILVLLQRFTALQKDSAEKRYLDLMNNQPLFLQRISQKHLASYIGITPTSLSRIRRNIT